jgi:hypothetical protein
MTATSWRLFMERAVAGSSTLAFPEPESTPQFKPWSGNHAYARPGPSS